MQNKFYWLNSKLKVKKTTKYGFGTFATEDIKKDELLLVLSGYVMRLTDEQNLPGSLSDNGIQISENLSLCISETKELGGINYFNHSCDPNVGIKGQIFLVAMKKIKAGEEATFDYAMTLHKSKGVKSYSLECLCGKKKCRSIITDDDWKNEKLQKAYNGYFQYFIQEKINNKKK